MIDTREELLGALQEAAELEHGLMVQYLFAAMTLRRGQADGLTPAQSTAISRWRETIYLVARQEMGHFGTVQNLLSILGAPAHFALPPFPSPARYYEPGQTFSLEPLTRQTIDRFVRFEAPLAPRGIVAFEVQPDPLVYQSVGDLYGQISTALGRIPERELFIGPSDAQDAAHWSFDVTVHPTRGLAEARTAIAQVVEEGEATATGGPASHYQRFTEIQRDYAEFVAADAAFVPFRTVAANPATMPGDGAQITRQPALDVARLFNATYKTLLLVLSQVYKFQDRADQPVAGVDTVNELRMAAIGLMQGVIRPLGQEVLPDLPADEQGVGAAPPFEIYPGPLAVHWDRKVAWRTLAERLQAEQAAADEMRAAHPALPAVADSLQAAFFRIVDLVG